MFSIAARFTLLGQIHPVPSRRSASRSSSSVASPAYRTLENHDRRTKILYRLRIRNVSTSSSFRESDHRKVAFPSPSRKRRYYYRWHRCRRIARNLSQRQLLLRYLLYCLLYTVICIRENVPSRIRVTILWKFRPNDTRW